MSQFTFRQQKDDFTNLLVAALQILSEAKQNQRVPAEQLQVCRRLIPPSTPVFRMMIHLLPWLLSERPAGLRS
jgi:hypothetical protein